MEKTDELMDMLINEWMDGLIKITEFIEIGQIEMLL